jgi:hypothetical protein
MEYTTSPGCGVGFLAWLAIFVAPDLVPSYDSGAVAVF